MKKKNPSSVLMLLLAIVILCVTTGVLLNQCLSVNYGQMAYTLDDAFIHLATAKNIARHGIFGITPFEFSSAESSLLWGLLLSAVAKTIISPSVLVYAPLLLNFAFAAVLLVVAHRAYNEGTVSSWSTRRCAIQIGNFLLLVALIFVSPLPWLIFSGMEHTLQSVLTVSFVYLAARRLSEEAPNGWNRADTGLLLLAPLVTTIRYEGLFPLSIICLFFLLRKRMVVAVTLGCAGVLPLVIFGMISVAHGSFLIPNSVLLKGRFGDAGTKYLIESLPHPLALFQLSERPYLTLLVLASSALLATRLVRFRSNLSKGFWHPTVLLTLVFLCVTSMNLQSALLRPLPGGTILWYVRYDAYLVVLGLMTTALAIRDLIARAELFSARALEYPTIRLLFRPLIVAMAIFSVLAAIAIFDDRAENSLLITPQATHNIYSQQWQMGQFVRRYYKDSSVALNDIGAVNFATDIHCVDLCGLATIEVAKSKIDRTFNTAKINSITAARGTKIAIVYSSWFYYVGGLPQGWKLVGQWKIPGNIICGDDTVSFYAVDPTEQDHLLQNLREYSKSLPPEVMRRFKQ